jgi:cyanophycinase
MKRLLFAFSLLFASGTTFAQQNSPANGWLIIHGGGDLSNEVKERFAALAGGSNAYLVMIPTAMDGDADALNKREAQFARNLGIRNFTVLHTRDHVLANSDNFAEPLRHATAVWIDGGRQWRLADAYLGTVVEREIKALLARGGVVFGSSAGASIQASLLVRGAPGTSKNPDGDNTIMLSPGHETGFGLLPNSAIDQHIDARGREEDLDAVIATHPELLGIGINQGAAIVVHGNSFFVASGQVAIHEKSKSYYYVSAGQSFNLGSRSVDTPPRTDVTLIVSSARRSGDEKHRSTSGTGVLGSQSITYECAVSLYQIGNTVYPAFPNGRNHFSVLAREVNTDQLREHPCTFHEAR